MAEDTNQHSDEYRFEDLDMTSPEGMDENMELGHPEKPKKVAPGSDVRRNALIVIGLVVMAMIVYKFVGAVFTGKKAPPPPPTLTPVATAPVAPPVIKQAEPAVVESAKPVEAPVTSQVNEKLSSLDQNQQTLRSDLNAINNQVGGLNTNVNELSNKIDNLNKAIQTLMAKMEQQSQEIAILTVRTKPKPKPVAVRKIARHRLLYFVQAIIPGRAWLIAENGSTLTVREGTIVPGYGVVKLIDPNQGRVLMSTGKTIRFSQQDS